MSYYAEILNKVIIFVKDKQKRKPNTLQMKDHFKPVNIDNMPIIYIMFLHYFQCMLGERHWSNHVSLVDFPRRAFT